MQFKKQVRKVADTTSGNVKSIWSEDGYLIAYNPS